MRDDLPFRLERSAKRQLGAPSLLRVESTVCFQRKRGLPSSIKTKAGQAGVVVDWEFCCVLCALTTCLSAAQRAPVPQAGITRRRGRRRCRNKAQPQQQPTTQSRTQQKSTSRAHAHDSRERANAHQLPQNRALP